VDVLSQGTGTKQLGLLKLRSTSGALLVSLFRATDGTLRLRNLPAGTTAKSKLVLPLGSWHQLQLHLHVAGAASSSEVWLDGAPVASLGVTQALGSDLIGALQLGDEATRGAWDVAFDGVDAGTALIPS